MPYSGNRQPTSCGLKSKLIKKKKPRKRRSTALSPLLIRRNPMNIQIFGTKKCFDTKKAIRYFKERNIKAQFIDLKEKGLSKGEYTKVKQAVGGLDAMLNPKCKDQDTLARIQYAVDDEKDANVLANQQVLKTPIVRNGAKATVGYVPEVWKTWE